MKSIDWLHNTTTKNLFTPLVLEQKAKNCTQRCISICPQTRGEQRSGMVYLGQKFANRRKPNYVNIDPFPSVWTGGLKRGVKIDLFHWNLVTSTIFVNMQQPRNIDLRAENGQHGERDRKSKREEKNTKQKWDNGDCGGSLRWRELKSHSKACLLPKNHTSFPPPGRAQPPLQHRRQVHLFLLRRAAFY